MTLPVSPLHLALIVAGVLLVVAVIVYNWWVMRAARQRIEARARPAAPVAPSPSVRTPAAERVEPTLHGSGGVPANAQAAYRPPADDPEAGSFSPPMDVIDDDVPDDPAGVLPVDALETPPGLVHGSDAPQRQPDPEIECIVTLQPARPVGVGAFASGLHARLGKRLRWFGRTAPDAPWQPLAADTRGDFVELAACLLLADRNGAASRAQLDTFMRVMSELAPTLPAAMSVPDIGTEAERAETLDRLCADVDVQVGLTILTHAQGGVPGTKLRGMAEAAGFHLVPGGRFEWVNEDTGAPAYSMQNLRNEPFTVDTLRTSATHGVVLVLDVPRVSDPPRVFDQMKLAGKRLATTLGGELVDDNRRPLDDPALAAIRAQVDGAAVALRESGIEPGSPRALALFGA